MSFLVIAEAVRLRFEPAERCDIGLLLRSIGASRRERNCNVETGIFRRFFDARASAENDQIGERNLFTAGKNNTGLSVVKLFLNAFESVQHI